MTRARTKNASGSASLPSSVAQVGETSGKCRESFEAREAELRAIRKRFSAAKREARREGARAVAARDALTRRAPASKLAPCGAKTRAGGHCQAKPYRAPGEAMVRNGRCRMHGGLSTGPRTAVGRERCGETGRRNLERRRQVPLR